MKKIISILLAVMLVVSLTVVSSGAVSYSYSDSYTVDANTPTCEEAILACGGSGVPTQKIYFQLPKEDPSNDSTIWTSHFNSTDLGLDYCQVCAYWWGGIGSKWPDGTGVQWVGYKTKLVDADNRIYEATLPADGGTPMMIWDNGVNGGMDDTKEIFNYARQIADVNIEGAEEGDYDTLPEGSPNPENMDNCIAIVDLDPANATENPLTHFLNYGSNWYVYYGNGCYGYYPTTSPNYHGRLSSCINPEHNHPKPGDVNNDKSVDIFDVITIQKHLAEVETIDKSLIDAADVDEDGYVSIIDATRIQRYLAKICNIDGSKPYKDSAE